MLTYPDDVLKAAREAAATDEENRAEAEKAAGNLAGHSWRSERARGYRNGKYDSEEKVTAACIAIMAERQKRQVSDSAHWAACELMDALLRLGNGATIEDRTGLIEEHMEAHGVAREMAERERCASLCICTAAGNVTRNNAPDAEPEQTGADAAQLGDAL